MLDELIGRLLPAVLFGAASGGVLWLLGLIRKRAALAAAILLALCFLANRWSATLPATLQLSAVAVGGWLLRAAHRLRVRDVMPLLAPATGIVIVAWLLDETSVYWQGAFVGALATGAAAWIGREATVRFDGVPIRVLTLMPTETGGINGPGAVCAAAASIVVAATAIVWNILGPGEPALVVAASAIGLGLGDSLRPARAGNVLIASTLGAVATAALLAGLP
ncbi:MAG: hypothetical protein GKS06_18805 [Acidobacteria bacterium]|nr:hypothetical protein [Acidobacteriota bacterium]